MNNRVNGWPNGPSGTPAEAGFRPSGASAIVLDNFNSITNLKQHIAAIYSLLSDRFPKFPKAQETWNQIATGEEFQSETLERLAQNTEIRIDSLKLVPLADSLRKLEKRARAEDLRLEEAYQISLEVSSIQVELMAHMIESVEYPHSLEIKNVASVMSADLLNLFDMMEKYTSASDVRPAVARTKMQLMALNLNFLEFDIKNYLTGMLGMSQMLASELTGEKAKELLDETYRHCSAIRISLQQLEKIRLRLHHREDR